MGLLHATRVIEACFQAVSLQTAYIYIYIYISPNIITILKKGSCDWMASHLLACWFLVRLNFDPEDGVIRSSEISVHIRTARRYIPEEDNFHNYSCENLKSYITEDSVQWHVQVLATLNQRFWWDKYHGIKAWTKLEYERPWSEMKHRRTGTRSIQNAWDRAQRRLSQPLSILSHKWEVLVSNLEG
jgi:hypothetical protein